MSKFLTTQNKPHTINSFLWSSSNKHQARIKAAQELQEILPEAVAEKTDGYLGVRYEKIIPLLIQSIKELQLEIK